MENGNATIPVDGPAAGEMYLELSEQKEQGPWDYTFVKGKGYAKFDDEATWAETKSWGS
jgi:hypothetical protein